jgi:hypothetical protein
MYLPAWSKHTVPHRGKIVHVEQSFVEILHAELTFLECQRHNILAGELAHVQRQLTAPENEPLTEDETDDSDTEYTIPHDHGQRDLQVAIREYQLRPRPALADITPTPDVVNAAHLDLLNFRRVKWDEYARCSVIFLVSTHHLLDLVRSSTFKTA